MAPHVDARIVSQLLQMPIGHLLPAGSQFLEIRCALCATQGMARTRAIALARAPLLRTLRVVAPEVLLRVARDTIHLPLGEHEVDVRLRLPVRCDRSVDRPLVSVTAS